MAEMPESINAQAAIVESLNFDEVDVIRRILDGSVNDFELLVQRHKGKVGRIVASRVRPEDVEDITHQTFVRAFKALGSFGGKAPFENWLSKLAVHCCYDYWRIKQRENARLVRPGEEAATLGWSLVKTKVKAMRARMKLRKAIDGLIKEWSK